MKDAHEDMSEFFQEPECPFCHGKFPAFPAGVKVFECGWCRNRVAVVKKKPAIRWKNFLTGKSSLLYYFMLNHTDYLSKVMLVPLVESVDENRKNLFVSMEMFFFAIVYITLCDYMQSNGSTSPLFNCVFFPAIPLVIGFVYYYFFISAEKKLLEPLVPVIRPGEVNNLADGV